MHIRIDQAGARSRVVAYLRERGYLAAEEPGGVLALPLHSVGEGYDRAALVQLLTAWGAAEKLPIRATVLRSADSP
jgi:hypothetical protein